MLYERAIEIARALDKHQASTGNTVGPLHGVPISVKDMVNIKDVDSTIGFTKCALYNITETDIDEIIQLDR